jgi:hypothetical protein
MEGKKSFCTRQEITVSRSVRITKLKSEKKNPTRGEKKERKN